MDLTFTEEQEMLRTTARDFLSSKCSSTLIREMLRDQRGYSPELWRSMADLGWMGIIFPEQYGGGEGSFVDLIILSEELGRACLPGPFFSTVSLGGQAILMVGREDQKQALLPKIAAGDLILAFAYVEPSVRYDPHSVDTTARLDQSGYIINGNKLFVENAHIADYIICAAKTAGDEPAGQDLALFLVESKKQGVQCTLLNTLAGDKQCEVSFESVRVSPTDMLGELDQGSKYLPDVLDRARLAKGAEMLGGIQKVLEMSIDYARERTQFGRPIGGFQAIQHYCADMAIEIDGARYLLYRAAWEVSEGKSSGPITAMAMAWINDVYYRTCMRAHEVLGAIGFTEEHDLQLYTRRAKAYQPVLGDSRFYREVVAGGLGL